MTDRILHGCESCDGEPECTCRPPMPPATLNSKTADLVARFAAALSEKLLAAQRKYGYSDGWQQADWMDECRTKLIEHVAKGDPRDVAAYCAFLWHHGEKTFVPTKADPYEALMNEVMACGGEVTPQEIIFNHATFDMFMQRHVGKTALDHFADEVEATLPLSSPGCRHSNRSDCGLYGTEDAATSFPLKRERPSREWYAAKIQETLDDDFVIGAQASPFPAAEACDRPPAGWACTRTKGHDGPCAASRPECWAPPSD